MVEARDADAPGVVDVPVGDIHVRDRLRDADPAKVSELAESIRLHGRVLQPIIVTDQGVLVAGLHRLRAVETLGWGTIPAVIIEDRLARLAEIDENLVRADLSVLEQGEHLLLRDQELRALGLRAPDHRAGSAFGKGATVAPFTTSALADGLGLSKRTAQERMQIARRLPKETRDLLRGTEAANRTRVLLQLARVRDRDELAQVAPLIASGKARTVPEARGLMRQQAQMAVVERLREHGPPPMPTGPFGVLVVDPPWPYAWRAEDKAHKTANPYPSMSMEDIAALPIGDLAADDAVLWLWTTNIHILSVGPIIEGWGFTHRSVLTWAKTTRPNIARWLLGQTEHVVLATKGSPAWSRTNETTLLRAANGEHSVKPDEFYALVEQVCPDPRRLDMFARQSRDGWAAWGAEVESADK